MARRAGWLAGRRNGKEKKEKEKVRQKEKGRRERESAPPPPPVRAMAVGSCAVCTAHNPTDYSPDNQLLLCSCCKIVRPYGPHSLNRPKDVGRAVRSAYGRAYNARPYGPRRVREHTAHTPCVGVVCTFSALTLGV